MWIKRSKMKIRKPNEVPASLKTIDVKAVLRKRGVYLKQRQYNELKEIAKPLAREMLKKKKKAAPVVEEGRRHPQFTNEQVNAYWEKQIHIVEILEKRFELKIQQFIGKMVDGFLTHLEAEAGTQKALKKFNAKGYFDDNEDDLVTTGVNEFTPILIDQAILAGQEAFKFIQYDDVYTPDKMRAKIAANVLKFTKSMIATDRDKLVQLLSDGLSNGLSVPEIRNSITETFSSVEKSQAQVITRTEVLRASNQATLDAYEQSGVVEGKQWLTAGASDECADYEGQVESLDGNFYQDTTEFQDGDPPLHPNCRCVLLPVLINE